MCWVMPPASPAATSVSRIASSSDVLPWSTWPMIVTTGGRGSRSSSASSNSGSASASSAAVTISISLSNSSASTWIASSDSVCVSVAISPRPISFLMISGTGDAEVLGDVLDGRAGVDPDDVGLQRADVLRRRAPRRCRAGAGRRVAAAGDAGGRRRGRRRAAAGTAAGRAAGGLRVDDDAAHAAGRAGGALALQRGARGPLALAPPGRRPAPLPPPWPLRPCALLARLLLALRRGLRSVARACWRASGGGRAAGEAHAGAAPERRRCWASAWRRCSPPWAGLAGQRGDRPRPRRRRTRRP